MAILAEVHDLAARMPPLTRPSSTAAQPHFQVSFSHSWEEGTVASGTPNPRQGHICHPDHCYAAHKWAAKGAAQTALPTLEYSPQETQTDKKMCSKRFCSFPDLIFLQKMLLINKRVQVPYFAAEETKAQKG